MPLHRTSGFTLIEVLVGVMLSGMILTAAYAAFQGIIQSQIRLGGVIDIQKSLFYLNEKIASIIHTGGTLDYEEYFNRRVLGYGQDFIDINGIKTFTFQTPSHYGNGDSNGKPPIYVCGFTSNSVTGEECMATNAMWLPVTTPGTLPTFNAVLHNQQAYGQYRELAFNYGSSLPSPIKLPSILPINDANLPTLATEGIPELYLIKKLTDGSYERTYFRQVYINPDPKAPCASGQLQNCLWVLQMTRLVSCDRMKVDGTPWADGIIDAWIPDQEFSNATKPLTCGDIVASNIQVAAKDLAWVNISSPDMDIIQAHFLPSPTKIPSLMSGSGEPAISPTIDISLEVQLSDEAIRRGFLNKMNNPTYTLSTTFDLADS